MTAGEWIRNGDVAQMKALMMFEVQLQVSAHVALLVADLAYLSAVDALMQWVHS